MTDDLTIAPPEDDGQTLTLRATMRPGVPITTALALDFAAKAVALVQAIADELAPGAIRYDLAGFERIDDGTEEIVVVFRHPRAAGMDR